VTTRRLLRRSAVAAPFLVLLALHVGCDSATGELQGGDPFVEAGAGCATKCDTTPTWTCLYTNCFGPPPAGQASCSTGQGVCHNDGTQTGAQVSGFVCGNTQQSCWEGMTAGIGLDAGGIFCPIVCSGVCPQTGSACPTEPKQQTLLQDIHKAQGGSGQLNNMPCQTPPSCAANSGSYTFSADDVARISAWIQAGAPNN
jgi:hypothetical protein